MANPTAGQYKVYDQNNIRIKVPFEIGTIIEYDNVLKGNTITCPFCFGTGKVVSETTNDSTVLDCPKCKGKGIIQGKIIEKKIGKVINFVIECTDTYFAPIKFLIQDGTYENSVFTPNSNTPKWIAWKKYTATDALIYKDTTGSAITADTYNISVLKNIAPNTITTQEDNDAMKELTDNIDAIGYSIMTPAQVDSVLHYFPYDENHLEEFDDDEHNAICTFCEGDGVIVGGEDGSLEATCPRCNGTGKIQGKYFINSATNKCQGISLIYDRSKDEGTFGDFIITFEKTIVIDAEQGISETKLVPEKIYLFTTKDQIYMGSNAPAPLNNRTNIA